jgi:hypothetical protein
MLLLEKLTSLDRQANNLTLSISPLTTNAYTWGHIRTNGITFNLQQAFGKPIT